MRAPMLYGTNSTIKLVKITFGTTTKRSKSKRLPACMILGSCTMLSFSRGGCIKENERMMMYSSRTKFKKNDASDVGRNLLSGSQQCTHYQQNEDLPLPEAQCRAGKGKRRTDKEFSTYPARRERTLTLDGQVQCQQ